MLQHFPQLCVFQHQLPLSYVIVAQQSLIHLPLMPKNTETCIRRLKTLSLIMLLLSPVVLCVSIYKIIVQEPLTLPLSFQFSKGFSSHQLFQCCLIHQWLWKNRQTIKKKRFLYCVHKCLTLRSKKWGQSKCNLVFSPFYQLEVDSDALSVC